MSRLNDGEKKKKVFHSSPWNHPYGNAAAVYRLCFALPQCVADIFIAYSATLEAATLPRLRCLKTRLRPVCWRPTPATHSIDGVNRRTRRATTRRSCKLYSAEVWATAEQVSVVPTCSAVQPPGWGRTMAWESHDVATGHNWRHGKRTSRRCVPRLGLCSCTYVHATCAQRARCCSLVSALPRAFLRTPTSYVFYCHTVKSRGILRVQPSKLYRCRVVTRCA